MAKIQIGTYEFLTKTKAQEHIRSILQRYKHNEIVRGTDHDFAMALLLQHPRRSVIVDCGVREFFVQHLDVTGRERRFCVRRVDSSIRDFSWRHVISPKDNRSQVMKVCRTLVRHQIQAFRTAAFGPLGILRCPVTGRDIAPQCCDIDYQSPQTFVKLVDDWRISVGLEYDDIEIVHKAKYQEDSRFSDSWMETNWREYHEENAVLRAVHPEANRSILRRRIA